jgi:SlyX protein
LGVRTVNPAGTVQSLVTLSTHPALRFDANLMRCPRQDGNGAVVNNRGGGRLAEPWARRKQRVQRADHRVMMRSMSEPNEIEERIAHLERALEDLSALSAGQAEDIDRLKTRVRVLMEREAGREADAGGGVVFGDERPPHW